MLQLFWWWTKIDRSTVGIGLWADQDWARLSPDWARLSPDWSVQGAGWAWNRWLVQSTNSKQGYLGGSKYYWFVQMKTELITSMWGQFESGQGTPSKAAVEWHHRLSRTRLYICGQWIQLGLFERVEPECGMTESWSQLAKYYVLLRARTSTYLMHVFILHVFVIYLFHNIH